jgi:capsule polysaccharide modification protein KpsS
MHAGNLMLLCSSNQSSTEEISNKDGRFGGKRNMAEKERILFSQMDLTNSINIIKYINEFNKDFDVVYTTFSNAGMLDKIASKSNIHPIHLPSLASYENRRKKTEIIQQLNKIETEIGIPLEKIIFADREFCKIYEKKEIVSLSWLIDIWNQYKQVIESNNILLHFCFGEDRLHNLIPYYQIKNRGGKSYMVRAIPYYGVTLTNDFFGMFTFTEKIEKDDVNFEEYKACLKESKVYFDPDIVNRVEYGKYWNIKRLMKRVLYIERIIWADRDNLYKDHNVHVVTAVARPQARRIKKKIAEIRIYGQIDPDQKYIYFPFHFTEDAQVRLKYPEGYNQYELIRNISRNLPIDLKLLVKEHPAYAGGFSLKELRDLSKHPNIVVLHPDISSKDIFAHIDFVITINSTVGYEALFYDKIVITMGSSFYESFPGVINIKDVKEIYDILRDEELRNNKERELKDHLKEITTKLLESSLEFDYYNFHSDENIRKMKDLLKLQMRINKSGK